MDELGCELEQQQKGVGSWANAAYFEGYAGPTGLVIIRREDRSGFCVKKSSFPRHFSLSVSCSDATAGFLADLGKQ